jgi:phosphatidylglycerol---prolipoprotein diacylglyceryl transferase
MTVYPFIIHIPFCLGIPGVFCIDEITGYGIMMLVAFFMGGWAMKLELRRRHLNEEYATDIMIAAMIGGILGAKLWYVALTGEPRALLSRGGLVWYGGFLGGTAAVLLNGWWKRVPTRFTLELAAPALALGYALGRVGCFLVNDDYGMPSNLPWAMKFPYGLPPSTVENLRAMHADVPANALPGQVLAVHPTQLYEVTAMFVVFWLLWRLRDHRHATGWLFSLYVLFAGMERFLVELVRAKDDRLIGALTLAQVTSILLVAVGLYLLRRWDRPDPVPLALERALKPPEPKS